MQKLRYSIYFKTLMIFIDFFIIVSTYVFFLVYRNQKISIESSLSTIAILSIFWFLLSGYTKLYHVSRTITYTLYLQKIFTHCSLFCLGILLLAKIGRDTTIEEHRFRLVLILFLSILYIKTIIFLLLKYLRITGKNFRNVMFLGENNSTKILREIISERKDYGYKIFDFQEPLNIENLKFYWKKNGIHTLFLSTENNLTPDQSAALYEEAEKSLIKINLVPNILQDNFFRYDLTYFETQPIISQARLPLDFYSNYVLKRVFDIVFSLSVLLLIGIWLFPIIAILIKFDSTGSVIFKQKRYGYHEEVFWCYKFRTMIQNSDSEISTTEKNDWRITHIGRFLRKTSLDEMPQFVNVLFGTMSVVGPRPHMLSVDNHYKPKIGRYNIRSLVRPGITGLAQVNGLRGDDGDTDIEMEKRILTDIFYVKNWTIALDMVIILKTIILIFKGDKKAY